MGGGELFVFGLITLTEVGIMRRGGDDSIEVLQHFLACIENGQEGVLETIDKGGVVVGDLLYHEIEGFI